MDSSQHPHDKALVTLSDTSYTPPMAGGRHVPQWLSDTRLGQRCFLSAPMARHNRVFYVSLRELLLLSETQTVMSHGILSKSL